MRKYFYIVLAFFFLTACEKEDVLDYQLTEDCIQFGYEAEDMELEYNFAEQTYEEYDDWGYPYDKYYGDSLLCDTLDLPLSIIGWESDANREFRLKLVPVVELDTLPLADVVLEPSYSFQANERRDTIRVIFMRPEAGERLAAGITFDLEGDDAVFDKGAEEQSVYNLIVENVYEETNWNEAYLGEFSQAKAAFIVTILQTNLGGVGEWSEVNQQLRAALEQYNLDHPDDQKDFTFPAYSEPTWWAANEQWLGEYSEEKKAFIQENLGMWDAYTNWEWSSLTLGYYYDLNPEAEYSFSRSDFRTLKQPDWWEANAQCLGKFSIPKAIFFEQSIFYGTSIWNDGATYDWAGNISYIKEQYQYYFYNPQAQPWFEDDFTVPEAVAPKWWENWSGYLGAYSDEKKAFMQWVFKDDKGEWWDKEASAVDWSESVNDLIEAYKTLEKPDFDNDFDPTGQWVKAPEWWPGMSHFLGAYSEAKKEFLINFFDPDGTKNWWEKEAATQAYGPYMGDLIARYEELYPDGGPFENDFFNPLG